MTVRTRIAPSPTGDPHVGTAYIALFNLCFARAHGGQFILRLDDTDPERSKQEYADQIQRDLEWLGLTWDRIERQSDRLDRYAAAAPELREAASKVFEVINGAFEHLRDPDTMAYTNKKVQENYSRRFSIKFPNEELTAARPYKTTPIYDKLDAMGAQWGDSWGLEAPLWFSPDGTKDVFSWRRSTDFEHVKAEVAAVRQSVGMMEISGFSKFKVSGPGARDWLDKAKDYPWEFAIYADRFMGVVGITGHLGYWLGKPFWGQGYMTEAAGALVDAYFDEGCH